MPGIRFAQSKPVFTLVWPHSHLLPGLFSTSKPLQSLSMEAAAVPLSGESRTQFVDELISKENYPIPLSPPLPSISKDIELNRALTASSRSSLFSLSRSDVLFEDESIIAVNKPQGIYCESILSAVRCLLNNGCGGGSGSEEEANLLELHLANRLDRDTSGVTVVTKSHKVAAKLVKAFTEHMVNKTYIAFCIGTVPKWRNMIIKSGHGRSKHGAWRVYSVSDIGRILPGGSNIKDMETSFEVLSVNEQGCFHELSGLENRGEKTIVVEGKSSCTCDKERAEILVKAHPRSGRTHQIRLHCQYLGIPVRGDVKYEGVHEWKGMAYEGHELHAESLSFEHPVKGQRILIQAPLPIWARQAHGHLLSEICSQHVY